MQAMQAWSQEGRDHVGAGAKIRPRVRLECSSQPGKGKVEGGPGAGGDAEPLALKRLYWVSFV